MCPHKAVSSTGVKRPKKKVSGTNVGIDGDELRIAHGETVASHISRCGVSRAQSRRTLFDDDGDYAAFERVLW